MARLRGFLTLNEEGRRSPCERFNLLEPEGPADVSATCLEFKDPTGVPVRRRETWCDQTFDRCKELGNQRNFGGFRFIPAIAEKQIWWGRVPS